MSRYAASIGGDQEPGCCRVDRLVRCGPPATDALDRERGGVVIGADADPPGVLCEFVDSVWIGPTQFWDDEVIDPHRLRITLGRHSRIAMLDRYANTPLEVA
jgi:hypothetical protein